MMRLGNKIFSTVADREPRKVDLPFRTDVCRLGQATVLLLFYSLVFDRAHLEVTDLR